MTRQNVAELRARSRSVIPSRMVLLACVSALAVAVGSVQVRAAPGDLDASFGSGGKVATTLGAYYAAAIDAIVQPDGKIVAAGMAYFAGPPSDFILARFHVDGSLDASFGAGGVVVTDIGGEDRAAAIARQPDGKLVVAGFIEHGSLPDTDYDFALARYNADGSLDASFGVSGVVTTDLGGEDLGTALVLQPDGKLVVAGRRDRNLALVRYLANGTLDGAFGPGGIVVTDPGPDPPNWGTSLVLQPDGRLVVAGSVGGVTGEDVAVARYNTDGGLDPTFGSGGVAIIECSGGQEGATDVALQADGKLVISSWASACGLLRLNANGTLDASFGSGGKVAAAFPSDSFYSVVLQGNGRILAAGESNAYSGLADFAVTRYALDGSLDVGFGVSGRVTTDFGLTQDTAHASVLQPGGKLVLVGRISGTGGTGFALARYEVGGGCPGAPLAGCRTAEKSLLLLKNDADDAKDKLMWKWIKGQATSQAELADPAASTDYGLCIYAGTAATLLTEATVPASATKWSPAGTKGYKYKDGTGGEDGIQKIILKGSAENKAKVLVKGKGANLPDPTLGGLAPPVTAQVVNADTGLCFEGVYTLGDIISNEPDQFKAKAQ